jgi:phosphoesterase RecJ-like protein
MLKPEVRRDLEKILALVGQAEQVVMTGHVHADGDVIGSLAALASWLEGRVKSVLPLLFEPVPPRYSFLDQQSIFRVYDHESADLRQEILSSDLLFILDLAVIERLPGWEGILREYKGRIACIDHHPPPEEPLGHVAAIDWETSSTGELLYEMFRLDGQALTRQQALALYTALATDTGWFKYSNTRPSTLALGAELLGHGIEPSEIFGYIYQKNDFAQVRMMGKMVHETHSTLQGQVLWTLISRRMMEEAGVEAFETEDLLDILRSVEGSRCVALFREMNDGELRVNLRSKGDLYINKLAERFGGGGHRKAAGITMKNAKIEAAAEEVIGAIVGFIENEGREDGG